MIADKDYGLTKDGKLCEQTDVKCASVLVGKGCYLADKEAEKYGLKVPEKSVEEPKAEEEKPKGGLRIERPEPPEKAKAKS